MHDDREKSSGSRGETSILVSSFLHISDRREQLADCKALFSSYSVFQSPLFFVMEYLNGGDLMFRIQQQGR